MTDSDQQQPQDKPMRLRDTLSSVLAAALGVQSNRARERDFSQANPATLLSLALALPCYLYCVCWAW